MQELKKKLTERLKGVLPGMDSHIKMVPEARRAEIERFHQGQDAFKAAVLICFVNNYGADTGIVLIRRNEYDGVHSGQISFPGGRYEDGDTDMVSTALREAEEETNIKESDVEVIGEISPVFIPPSNFFVTPVIAWARKQPELIPDPSEVSEIYTISLEQLMDPANRQIRNIAHREFKYIDVPCFYIQGNIIWGATAMMLMELMDILDET
ncbi:MAG: CoA pyrophosphatase [Bacteroidales bacterium]|jgi:8-oxo-dGTP pyrophosphatase MutT (NUDIX family)|nr:CoA pyrophosphatase [Bacteroidales bacterium]